MTHPKNQLSKIFFTNLLEFTQNFAKKVLKNSKKFVD